MKDKRETAALGNVLHPAHEGQKGIRPPSEMSLIAGMKDKRDPARPQKCPSSQA
ncbi:hypothetical protein B4096_0963 [Heyndrickxia coagulans]|uniref:Uncharacterized protein n=1 Tax=Heyndrickxia coagulans TaxID=1398 RepID=A0A133KAE3_HEYCO|nr:hypothetical protein HMPREF3213_03781 [Heyndrickxia coagulans]KYC64670.1 hypothetical protein B4100_1020 [Heyndrickxia coagulans]KYC77741.1 hypothetical protein B4096_0963 [Heyndrickxia coagulans]